MRFIYRIRNLINEKVYIGQTKNPDTRKADHFAATKCNSGYKLHRSIRKHGVENFVFEIVEECDDSVANDREIYWIQHHDCFNTDKGYNLTSGGEQNFTVSDETRLRMSLAHKGKPLSEANKRNLWLNRSREFSEDHRRALSEAAKVRRASAETREKMSKALKGKQHRCGSCNELGHTRLSCKKDQQCHDK